MDALFIKGTEETPLVHLDSDKGIFILEGKSFMEDVVLFYTPVLKWLKLYAQEPIANTEFIFKLEYLNTSSSKIVLDILELLDEIHATSGSEVLIKWHFFEEDEDIEQAGHEYKELNDLPFEFVEVSY